MLYFLESRGKKTCRIHYRSDERIPPPIVYMESEIKWITTPGLEMFYIILKHKL